MNYPESKLVLEKVKQAKRILLNCHKSPDPDSIGCALAMARVLTQKYHKEVSIFCPTVFDNTTDFLDGFGKIENRDFAKIDFSEFDLFIVLDSSSCDFATGLERGTKAAIPVAVIDHHKTNENFGDINLVNSNLASTAELLYQVFADWQVDIDKEVATALLTGIIADTGTFRFPGTTARTLEIAGRLMALGADKDEIIFHLNFSIPLAQFKFWGEVLDLLRFDEESKIAWTAVPYRIFSKYDIKQLRESTATTFFQSIKDSEMGVVMVEEEVGRLNVSLRSRTGVDVSVIAKEFGGGGHRYAAGCGLSGLPFEKAVEKILEVCRKYAKT